MWSKENKYNMELNTSQDVAINEYNHNEKGVNINKLYVKCIYVKWKDLELNYLMSRNNELNWIGISVFQGELRFIHSPCQVVNNKMAPFVAEDGKELGSFQCKGSLEGSL